MDWSTFTNIKSIRINYVQTLNKLLTGQSITFHPEAFLKQGSIETILKYLDTKTTNRGSPLSASTQKIWLSSVSNILSKAGFDRTTYSKEITRLGKVKPVKPIIEDTENVASHIIQILHNDKANHHVRLMCGLLHYNHYNDIKLIDLCNTRHDIDNDSDNYIDLIAGKWKIHKHNQLPKIISVSKEFLELINSHKGPQWITRNKIKNTNSMSIMFRNILNRGYRDTALILLSSKMKLKPKITIKHIALFNLSTTELNNGVEWDTLDKSIRLSSRLLHINCLKHLQQFLFNNTLQFYPHFFASDKGLLAVQYFLKSYRTKKGKCYSINTKANYLSAVCKYTERDGLSSIVHTHYSKLLHSLQTQIIKLNNLRPIIPFEPLIKNIQYLYNTSSINNIRVIMWIILNSIDLKSNTNIGILRFSDLIHTKLSVDPVFSYIDTTNKTWLIRSDHTKNTMERTLNLSNIFVKGLLDIFQFTPTWIISNNNQMCSRTNHLSTQFHKLLNITCNDARASYITYMNKALNDVGKCQTLAKNMGHAYKTKELDYTRGDFDCSDSDD